VQPLPLGEARYVSCRITWLSHGLFRSGGVLDPDRLASLSRGTDVGDVARKGVGEAGGMVDLGARVP
jgi:hypothetical protein